MSSGLDIELVDEVLMEIEPEFLLETLFGWKRFDLGFNFVLLWLCSKMLFAALEKQVECMYAHLKKKRRRVWALGVWCVCAGDGCCLFCFVVVYWKAPSSLRCPRSWSTVLECITPFERNVFVPWCMVYACTPLASFFSSFWHRGWFKLLILVSILHVVAAGQKSTWIQIISQSPALYNFLQFCKRANKEVK